MAVSGVAAQQEGFAGCGLKDGAVAEPGQCAAELVAQNRNRPALHPLHCGRAFSARSAAQARKREKTAGIIGNLHGRWQKKYRC